RLAVQLYDRHSLPAQLARLGAHFQQSSGTVPLSLHPAWLPILQRGLRHVPFCLEARTGENHHGFLALAYVSSLLFGRFLVSLPYVNYGGAMAGDPATRQLVVDCAVRLADDLDDSHLEVGH